MSDLRGLWQRLRDTHLVRWTGIYGAAALVVLSLADPIREPWGLSDEVMQSLQILLLAGLPTTLIVTWFHGETGRQRFRPVEIALLGLVTLATGLATLTVWRGTGDPAEGIDARTGQLPHLPNPSELGVAVLPFEHLGPEERRDLTRAIQGEVTDGLSQISALTVLSRGAVQGRDVDGLSATEAATRLGVRYLLYGQIQWTDQSLLLNVRLVDGGSGVQVGDWEVPARYRPEEVFPVQASVAGHVARAVRVEVLPREDDHLAIIPTGDALAMDAYLLGMSEYSLWGLDVAAMDQALRHMERAVQRDSTYGAAWARLAFMRGIARAQHRRDFPAVTGEEVRQALEKAEEWTADAPETLLARAAWSYWEDRDWSLAERQLNRLTQRMPNWSEGHRLLGLLLRRMDQWERAIAELEAAVTLDPRSFTTLVLTAEANHLVGRLDRGLELSRRATEIEPGLVGGVSNTLRTLLWGLGDTTSAKEVAGGSNQPVAQVWMDYVLRSRGDFEGALALGERLGSTVGWQQAILYRELGDTAAMHRAAEDQRRVLSARLAQCPPPDVQDLCRQESHALLGLVASIVGDSANAVEHLEASAVARDRFYDGYHSTVSLSYTALAYAQLGLWRQATDAVRDQLSRPSFHHPPMLRMDSFWAATRRSYPPFVAMLDSVQVRGPLFE